MDKIKYVIAGCFLIASAGLVACEDDEMPVDEWSSTYVYLARNSLSSDVLTFELSHMPSGIVAEEMVIPVTVRLSKTRKSDVTVVLKKTIGGEMPAEAAVFKYGGTLVIPAGELESRDTVTVSNWDFAAVSKDAAEYTIDIAIDRVHPASGDLRISSRENICSVQINKSHYSNVYNGKRPEGARIEDRSGWVAKYSDDPSGVKWLDGKALLDNDNYSYAYVYNYLCIEVDMGSAQKLTGLETVSGFGANYAHTSCSILSSDDGATWTTQSAQSSIASAGTQYVAFATPVTARYLRWMMWGGNCLSSEIYAWQVAE